MAFTASIEQQGSDLLVSLNGPIDENSEFPEVPSGAGKIVFDLEGVKYINSIGIKMWIQWMTPMAAQSGIEFKNCPKAIVLQMNMVKNFLPPGAQVSSFYLPLFCEECDLEDSTLVQVSDIQISGEDVTLPDLPKCEKSECEMEIDVIPKKYFRFLKGDV